MIFAALSINAQEIIKYKDLPAELQDNVSKKEYREVVKIVEEREGDFGLTPIEMIAYDVEPATFIRNGAPVQITSWGRDVLLPQSIRQRVINECGKYPVYLITVDSGVDTTHSEYRAVNFLPSANYTGQTGMHWHGTHVTGIHYQIIAEVNAVHNNFKFKNSQILNASGSGNFSSGINMVKSETALFSNAAANGTGVIFNNSWGADIPPYKPFDDEVAKSRQAGMIWLGAAGNAGRVVGGYPGSSPYFTSVAALSESLTRASYSTMNDSIDIAAPGSNINSTLPSNTQGKASGTSMASPFASAVAALAYGKYGPILQGEAMNIYLRHIATDISPTGRDNQTGYGIVWITSMLDKDPCDVPGIDCDGTTPPPPPNPDPTPDPDPTPPDEEPTISYVAGISEGAFQMYWKRQSDTQFRVMVFTEIEWQGIYKGPEGEAFKAFQKQVISYFNNRALVLTDEMGEWSAAKWTGRFLEIISKINGAELEVERIVGRDENGNKYRAENSDIKSAVFSSPTEYSETLTVFSIDGVQLVPR